MQQSQDSIYNSNIPLNQQMFSAVNMNEGGEPEYDCTTERGLHTRRGFLTSPDEADKLANLRSFSV